MFHCINFKTAPSAGVDADYSLYRVHTCTTAKMMRVYWNSCSTTVHRHKNNYISNSTVLLFPVSSDPWRI